MDLLDEKKKKMHYRVQQQTGRKELWREAFESSSKGDYFLVSLLEVVLEDEHAQKAELEKRHGLDRLVKVHYFLV
jgi:hypothetical protein